MSAKIGIIGGSGFYKLLGLEDEKRINVSTPFGDVGVIIGVFGGKNVAFIPRHGEKHTVPPHMINYRANVYALFSLGVEKVIATSAVGSLKSDYKPGDILIPDQIIDFTKNRTYTFFDGRFSVKLHNGSIRKGVYHVDVTNPYCEELRSCIFEASKEMGLRVHFGGTYVCTEGPRFETPAEIKFFQLIGGDVVGMTNSPEVFLFKELDICYALICVITNFAAGMQKRITQEEVLEIFREKASVLAKLIENTIRRL